MESLKGGKKVSRDSTNKDATDIDPEDKTVSSEEPTNISVDENRKSRDSQDLNDKLEVIAGIKNIRLQQSICVNNESIETKEDHVFEKKEKEENNEESQKIHEFQNDLEIIADIGTIKRLRSGELTEETSEPVKDLSFDDQSVFRYSLDVIGELDEDTCIKDTLGLPTDSKSNRLSWKSVDSVELLQTDETETSATEEDEYMYHYDENRRQGVTKSHFVPKEDRDSCQSCSTPLTSLSFRRPHHCRRCGDIFCRTCLLYRKKLNIWAQPDTRGILCKVCLKCFSETEVVLFGIKRSITEDFVSLRRQCKTERRHILCDVTLERRNGSIVPAPWKEQVYVDIPTECRRLLSGFKQAVGSSDAQKAIHEMAGSYIVPSWQRAKFWTLESTTLSCRECGKKLEKRKYRNCRVCALALCKKCSCKELLIYYEDGTHPSKDTSPRLAVIKVLGCPQKEPRYSLRLSMCKDCRDYIVERQQENPDWFIDKPKPEDPDLITSILDYDRVFRELMTDIHEDLGKITEKHEQDSPNPVEGTSNTETANDQTAVNSHPDQTDTSSIKESLQSNLNKYFDMYQRLRKIADNKKAGASRSVTKLSKNYLQARNNFYVKYRSKESAISINRCK